MTNFALFKMPQSKISILPIECINVSKHWMAVDDVTTLQQSLSATSFFDSVKIVVTIRHQFCRS